MSEKEKDKTKPNKIYTKVGNNVKIVELKEVFSERIISIEYLLRRRKQLEEAIEQTRNELEEINEVIRGVK